MVSGCGSWRLDQEEISIVEGPRGLGLEIDGLMRA